MAPQNTFLGTIIRKFEGQSKFICCLLSSSLSASIVHLASAASKLRRRQLRGSVKFRGCETESGGSNGSASVLPVILIVIYILDYGLHYRRQFDPPLPLLHYLPCHLIPTLLLSYRERTSVTWVYILWPFYCRLSESREQGRAYYWNKRMLMVAAM